MGSLTQEQIGRARLRGFLSNEEALDLIGLGPFSASAAAETLKFSDRKGRDYKAMAEARPDK